MHYFLERKQMTDQDLVVEEYLFLFVSQNKQLFHNPLKLNDLVPWKIFVVVLGSTLFWQWVNQFFR